MSGKALVEYSDQLMAYFKKYDIKIFDCSQHENLKVIGSGGFAVVYSAILEGEKYALKSLKNNLSLNEKEFKQFRRELDSNRMKEYLTGNFMLVLQLATDGNLRDYLRSKQDEDIYKISWTELIKIAKDITSGLKHLHDKNIIHRDLHSKNILIDGGKALISDFGISKRLIDTTASSSDIGGVPAYLEPQCCLQNNSAKRDKRSDIYSLGVLLWELTSGVPPFYGLPDLAIFLEISHDKREKTIENTPPNYANLYNNCWSSDPDLRPKLNEIILELEKLSIETIEFITNPVDNKKTQGSNNFAYNAYSTSTDTFENLNSNIHIEEHNGTPYNPNECDDSLASENKVSMSLQNYSHSITIQIDFKESSEQNPYQQKHVELLNGNLLIELPILTNLLVNVHHKTSKEFTHMRYTACTSKPRDFKKENFTLRQIEYNPPRHTELFILINIHGDDEIPLSRTLYGIMENIAYLCSIKDCKTWGKDGWKKIVVCIVSVGRINVNKHILAYLTALGVYQNDIAKAKVDKKAVNAHIYEYTTSISIKHSKDSVEMKMEDDGIIPTQMLFCLTEWSENDSYQWFLDAFCPILNPKICVFIDAGVKPSYDSLYNLWETLSVNPQIAGVCGNISFTKGGKGGNKIRLLNPIVGAQTFNYERLNILDKQFESAFGYITPISECFSAYQYSALQSSIGLKSTNKYTLDFELVTRPNHSWTVHFQKSIQAEIDGPENLWELILQQKYHMLANPNYISNFRFSFFVVYAYYGIVTKCELIRTYNDNSNYSSNNHIFNNSYKDNYYCNGFYGGNYNHTLDVTIDNIILKSSFFSSESNNMVVKAEPLDFAYLFEENIAKVVVPSEITINNRYIQAWNQLKRTNKK
ncbi:15624_t:CDS:10, partial [Cetraspora pellucida]